MLVNVLNDSVAVNSSENLDTNITGDMKSNQLTFRTVL